MKSWYMIYPVTVLSALLGYAAYEWVAWSKMGAAEWASWVQAIGSIAAIIGAYVFGERQAKANVAGSIHVQEQAERKRRAAYFAIAEAARAEVERFYKLIDTDLHCLTNRITILLAYSENWIKELKGAMEAVPIHELGTPESVSAWIGARNTFDSYFETAKKFMSIYESTDSEQRHRELVWHRDVIENQASTMKSQYSRLSQTLDSEK